MPNDENVLQDIKWRHKNGGVTKEDIGWLITEVEIALASRKRRAKYTRDYYQKNKVEYLARRQERRKKEKEDASAAKRKHFQEKCGLGRAVVPD